jgi:tetratricopeptide (TPR) repeat protein
MMFAIIFGSRNNNNVMGQTQFVCPQCRRQAYHTVVRSSRWFTLYFIPVIPMGKTTTARCNLCGFRGQISNEQADSWFPKNQAGGMGAAPMNQPGMMGVPLMNQPGAMGGMPQKTAQQWMNEGQAHYGAMRYNEALAAYEQTIRLDPNFAGGYYNKGLALKVLMRYEEALAAFDQAIRLAPNVPQAYHEKGTILDTLSRPMEARQAYDMALRLGYRGS